MSKNQYITENDLDELLRGLLLEENSSIINEAEANFVLTQNFEVEINKDREKALLKRLSNKPRKNGGFKWFIIAVIILGLAFLLWKYFDGKEKNKVAVKEDGNVTQTLSSDNENQGETKIVQDANPIIKIKDTFGRPKTLAVIISDTNKIKNQPEIKTKEIVLEKTVPFISEIDIKLYRKIKEQIILKIVNKDKALYTFIPAEKTVYSGKEIILDAFTLRNVGITNLEYKTFLADLLSQKRNEEYLKAAVKANGWSEFGYPGFANTYFDSDKYNDFPVVNITYEGATLFCNWLQEELDAYIKRNKIKLKDLKIRMPYDDEWIYAAREGYAKIAFEKGYNTIFDETEGLVDKSFTKREMLVKKRVMKVDTMYAQFTTNHYWWTEKELNDFFEKGFKYYMNVLADTIYGDRMKVLGKIGRVSEMTGQRAGSKIWLSGQSWNGKSDYMKLEKEFNSNLYSPFVGFRIVLINPNDPEYKNPFW
ncbi:MAG TPA: SUMF1/EgtB/PvdO family nonheme iron enzyme [Bacteroidia bacterium]|jgi:hypothetical protein|nr:SUMF1/EgtB/PvdO family nonheme iron enzyme [Bacteroidia bacterium]